MNEIFAQQILPSLSRHPVSYQVISSSLHPKRLFVKSLRSKNGIAPIVPKTKLVCRCPACASVQLSVSYPRSALSRSAHFYNNVYQSSIKVSEVSQEPHGGYTVPKSPTRCAHPAPSLDIRCRVTNVCRQPSTHQTVCAHVSDSAAAVLAMETCPGATRWLYRP